MSHCEAHTTFDFLPRKKTNVNDTVNRFLFMGKCLTLGSSTLTKTTFRTTPRLHEGRQRRSGRPRTWQRVTMILFLSLWMTVGGLILYNSGLILYQNEPGWICVVLLDRFEEITSIFCKAGALGSTSLYLQSTQRCKNVLSRYADLPDNHLQSLHNYNSETKHSFEASWRLPKLWTANK